MKLGRVCWASLTNIKVLTSAHHRVGDRASLTNVLTSAHHRKGKRVEVYMVTHQHASEQRPHWTKLFRFPGVLILMPWGQVSYCRKPTDMGETNLKRNHCSSLEAG